MIVSFDKRYIFFENPKTGSSSVVRYLTNNDKTCKRDYWNDKLVFNFEGHIPPRQFVQKIGNEKYEKFKKFIFIRNPYDKAVSAYFFYRKKEHVPTKKDLRKSVKDVRYLQARIKHFVNYIIAFVLPFEIYSMIMPIKLNSSYLFDKSGKIIVSYVGLTEKLGEDLSKIINECGIEVDNKFDNKKVNISNHSKVENYFTRAWHKRWFYQKYKSEIEIFDKIRNIPVTTNLEGKLISEL